MSRRLWWKLDGGAAASAVWKHLTALGQWRERRLRDHAILAFLYERERFHGLGLGKTKRAIGAPDLDDYYDYPRDARPSVNLVKSRVDTVGARIFGEVPAVEVTPYNAQYELGFASERMSDVLNGTMNTPTTQQSLRRIGRDGLLTGFGACMPVVRDGHVRCVRILYRQLWWDPADAQSGDPRSLHYWVRMSRDQVVGMVESWGLGKAQTKKLTEQIEALSPAGEWGPLGEKGKLLTPYEKEMASGATGTNTYGADLIHLVYSWHLPGRADGADGKYLITAHGGSGVVGEERASHAHVVLHDAGWTRTTFPVCWWTPYPPHEGIDGVGLGHTLYPFQVQHDRSWCKLDRELAVLGHTKILMFGDKDQTQNVVYPGVTVVQTGIPPASPAKPYEVIPGMPQSPQEIEWSERVEAKADATIGVNQMMSQGGTKLGAQASGVALMEEDDRQMDRFRDVENEFDRFLLRYAEETLNACDDEAERSNQFAVKYFGADGTAKRRTWAQVSMPAAEYSVTLEPVGALGRRKAGRLQKVLELAQLGAVTGTAALREMAGFADLRRLTEVEQAGLRLVEWQIAGLSMKGNDTSDYDEFWPTRETPLDIARQYGLSAIQLAQRRRALEATLARLREYVAMVDALEQEVAAEQPPAAPPAMPVGDPGAAPPMPLGAPIQ